MIKNEIKITPLTAGYVVSVINSGDNRSVISKFVAHDTVEIKEILDNLDKESEV